MEPQWISSDTRFHELKEVQIHVPYIGIQGVKWERKPCPQCQYIYKEVGKKIEHNKTLQICGEEKGFHCNATRMHNQWRELTEITFNNEWLRNKTWKVGFHYQI